MMTREEALLGFEESRQRRALELKMSRARKLKHEHSMELLRVQEFLASFPAQRVASAPSA